MDVQSPTIVATPSPRPHHLRDLILYELSKTECTPVNYKSPTTADQETSKLASQVQVTDHQHSAAQLVEQPDLMAHALALVRYARRQQ